MPDPHVIVKPKFWLDKTIAIGRVHPLQPKPELTALTAREILKQAIEMGPKSGFDMAGLIMVGLLIIQDIVSVTPALATQPVLLNPQGNQTQ